MFDKPFSFFTSLWLCWNFREKGGKKTKVPIAASGEKTGTDKAHCATWVTFDEAQRAAREKNYSGVGYCFYLIFAHFGRSYPMQGFYD